MCTNTCVECDYHETYLEEDNGEYYDEGCYCNHEEGNNKYHIDNCIEFVTNGKYKGCPYFKDEEE